MRCVGEYRKRVRQQTAKNYQWGLFQPDDGFFQYLAIVTNKEVRGPIWYFICGRGSHENVCSELKGRKRVRLPVDAELSRQ